MPQSLNQELRTFTKIFDCFLDKEQVIKSYQEFYSNNDEQNEPINTLFQILHINNDEGKEPADIVK